MTVAELITCLKTLHPDIEVKIVDPDNNKQSYDLTLVRTRWSVGGPAYATLE